MRNDKVKNIDTPIVDQAKLNGLWLVSKNKYESSFIFICNDTIYFLKGAAEKYYMCHDTFNLTVLSRFKQLIIELDSVHLIWMSNSGEISTLTKKTLK